MITSLPLACTGCFDLLSQYRYPHGDWLLWGMVLWGIAVLVIHNRTPVAEHSQERWLPGCAAVLLTGLGIMTLTLTVRMLLPILVVAWGVALVVAMVGTTGRQRLPHTLGLVMIPIAIGFSQLTYHTREHQLAWLGRLPPHSGTNMEPFEWVTSHPDVCRSPAIDRFQSLTQPGNEETTIDELRQISVLARAIGEIGGETACAALNDALHWTPGETGRFEQDTIAAIVLSAAVHCGNPLVPQLREIWNTPADDPNGLTKRLAAGLGMILCDDSEIPPVDIAEESARIIENDGAGLQETALRIAALTRKLADDPSTADETIAELMDRLYPPIGDPF